MPKFRMFELVLMAIQAPYMGSATAGGCVNAFYPEGAMISTGLRGSLVTEVEVLPEVTGIV